MPVIFLVDPARAMLAFLMIFDCGLDLMVRARLNDAMPGFLARVARALTRLATSIGFTQVAGSATILPFLGPAVHLNLRLMPDLVLPRIFLAASSAGSTASNSSQTFITCYLLASISRWSVQAYEHMISDVNAEVNDDKPYDKDEIGIPIFFWKFVSNNLLLNFCLLLIHKA